MAAPPRRSRRLSFFGEVKMEPTLPSEPSVIELRKNYPFYVFILVLTLGIAVFFLWFGATTQRGLLLWRVFRVGVEGSRAISIVFGLVFLFGAVSSIVS